MNEKNKLSIPHLLLAIMGVIIFLVVEQFTLNYFEGTLNNTTYLIIALLHDIAILFIFYFLILSLHIIKRHDLKYFITIAVLTMILPTLYILLRILEALDYYMMLGIFNRDLNILFSIIGDIVIQWPVFQLPLIVLASGFLIKENNKMMRNISIITLIISTNIGTLILLNTFGYNFIAKFHLSKISMNELYLLSLFIFTFGLFTDYKNALNPKQENESNNQPVYTYSEEKTFFKYFSPSGRVKRSGFWLFILIMNIVLTVATVGLLSKTINLTAFIIILTIASIVQINMSTKRLHDIGIGGWYQIISLIPLIGQAILLWKYIQPSKAVDNQYGKQKA